LGPKIAREIKPRNQKIFEEKKVKNSALRRILNENIDGNEDNIVKKRIRLNDNL